MPAGYSNAANGRFVDTQRDASRSVMIATKIKAPDGKPSSAFIYTVRFRRICKAYQALMPAIQPRNPS